MNKCPYCEAGNLNSALKCLRCYADLPYVKDERKFVTKSKRSTAPVHYVESGGQQYPVTQASMKEFGKYSAIILLVIALASGFIFALNKYEPFSSSTSAPAASTESISADSGYYLDYKYTLMSKGDAHKVVALFQPKMLPRDDQILVGATQKVIMQAFGKEVSAKATLSGSEIKFTSPDGHFYVLPVKEDSGQIHSLVIRR